MEAAERTPLALTFVIDQSGSMSQENRLGLVKQSLKLLLSQLDERDTIGIVTFSTQAREVLQPHQASYRSVIEGAIDSLSANGSTNAGEGLRLGYRMAERQYRGEAMNRVILCSDGVANTGVTGVDGILNLVRRHRESQVFLNTIGVGMGNHNDALMEQLADRGDGQCLYVGDLAEARRAFVTNLVSTFQTVARNTKVQVEFDPRRVLRYRLLGYENRAVADRDFRNDAVDAGELNAGQAMIALYELEVTKENEGPLAEVRIRYEHLERRQVEEISHGVRLEQAAALEETTRDFRWAAAVAEFAEMMRQSYWARDGSLGDVLSLAKRLVRPEDHERAEFLALVQQAARIPDLLPRRTALAGCLDALKRNRCLEVRFEDHGDGEAEKELAAIAAENRRLEARLRELLEKRTRR